MTGTNYEPMGSASFPDNGNAVNQVGVKNTATDIHTESYYAASANRKIMRPALGEDIDIDVAIVGGGYSGLSTALALCERGYKVCVIEANAIGWGASGRNGGQVINGLNAELGKIERQFGSDASQFVGGLLQEGGEIIRERIKKYDIQCDYREGNIFTAHTKRHMVALENKKQIWNDAGVNDLELLDRNALSKHIGSDNYCGGMIDHSGGHLHPLNLALGEADAIESLGGIIFEQSAVTGIEKSDDFHIVKTELARVKCRVLVLCGNAYLEGVAPEIEKRIMPVSTQIVTTKPLDEALARSILPTNMCIEDTRYILDYYRLTADNRLLFGGGTVYGGRDPDDIRSKLAPNIEKVFPQLGKVELEFAWSGNFALSFSRVPQMGRLASRAYFAHGYSGHGITGSHLFGSILADAVDGNTRRFDVFASLPYIPFPGGRALRVPYSVAGSWWYGLRDKFGI